MPVIIFGGLASIIAVVLACTAVGGNGVAETFSGIPRARVVFTTYVISSFGVAMAGLLQASRSLGSQNTVGQGPKLDVLAAVILGGASLLGGSGTVFKTVIGVLILGFIQNGLLLVGLQFYVQYVVTWVIIMAKGAIWGFIVLELIFFSIAGEFLSLSDKAFMDAENMMFLFKQPAPIGIIALGMTIVMINGNIDLSVGATSAVCAIVMLDSMTWPIFAGLGDWVIPVASALALMTGMLLGPINGLIVWKTGVDAFIVMLGLMLAFAVWYSCTMAKTQRRI